MRTFLDLGAVEGLIAGLAEQRKALVARAAQHARARDEAFERARRRFGGAVLPPSPDDLLPACRAWLGEVGIPIPDAAGWSELLAACAGATDRAGSPASVERKRQLDRGVDLLSRLIPPENPHAALEAARVAESQAGEADLASLLTDALEHVEHRGSDRLCPVCEQPVDSAKLTLRLRERLAVLEEVRVTRDAVRWLGDAWRSFLDALDSLERDVFCDVDEAPPRLTGKDLLEHLVGAQASLSVSILSRLDRLRVAIAAEREALRDVDRVEQLLAVRTAIEAVAAEGATIQEEDAAHADLQGLIDAVKAVEKAIGRAYSSVFETEVAGADGYFKRFYQRVHPCEDAAEVTGPPSIRVKRYGAGTAELDGVFNGETIGDPRRLYSDGHLDTVAICWFLAFRRARADRDGPRDPHLMVLDDVILSIDNGHAEKLIRLIADEFGDHQVLVLSHNELFMQLCRGPLHRAKWIDIVRWSLDAGPVLLGRVRHLQKLEETLEESGSPEQLASAFRIVLDELLDVGCEAFDVRLPSGRRGLTVAECWNPLRKKLRESGKKLGLPDLEPIFERIEAPEFFRNSLGAHRNRWALQGDLRSMQRVTQALIELVRALECPECNAVRRPRNHHDPAAGLRCECRTGASPGQAVRSAPSSA